MAVKLPTKTSRIRTDSQDLMRVQDNLSQVTDTLIQEATSMHDGTAAIKVASATSGAGFKAVVGPFAYSTTNTPHLAFPNMNIAVYVLPAGTAGSAPHNWVAPFPGSVIGLSAYSSALIATTTQVFLIINGSNLTSLVIPVSTQSASATYARNTYTFNAGAVLTLTVDYGAAGLSTTSTAHMVVEMAA